MIEIQLNGQKKEIPAAITLAHLLDELKLKPERVAIEVNREIVKRDQWSSCVVQDGDSIEIVHFVGGGSI